MYLSGTSKYNDIVAFFFLTEIQVNCPAKQYSEGKKALFAKPINIPTAIQLARILDFYSDFLESFDAKHHDWPAFA